MFYNHRLYKKAQRTSITIIITNIISREVKTIKQHQSVGI